MGRFGSLIFTTNFNRALSAAALAFVCACGGGGAGKGGSGKPDAPEPTPTPVPLVLSVSSNLITTANTATLSFVGGTEPITWTIVDGPGTVSGTTVTPDGVGNIRVKGADAGTQNAIVTITSVAALAAPVALLEMIQGQSTPLASTGGVPPITTTVVSGPATYALGTLLAGPGTGAGVIRFVDRLGNQAETALTVGAPVALAGATDMGINQSTQLTPSGGFSPYTYSIVSGGGSMSADGIYTAGGSATVAIVRVTDRLGNSAPKTINVAANVSILPSTATVAVTNTYQFNGSGGVAPYTFAIASGGGSVNSSTGLFTAGASAGTTIVRITDSAASTATATVTVNPAVAITPSTATLLVNGTQAFVGSGGVGSLVYSVQSGTGSVNASTGVYTAPASSGSAVVRATDTLGNFADAAVTIVNPVQISPTALTVAVSNSHTFTATDGAPPYIYSIVSGGGSINSSTGAFTAGGTAGTTVVRVTDTLSSTSDATITVNPAITVTPSPMELITGETRSFTVSGGVPAITSQIISGSITLGASDITAGITAGAAQVRFTDSLGNIRNLNISIANPIALAGTGADVAVNANMTFTATGGFTAYTYSKQSGVGSINATTGVFTSASAGSAVILVTDRLGHTATANVTVHGLPSISPDTITLAADNATTFLASGGLAPYSFSVVSGGGSIDPLTGDFLAPSAAATVVVRVTDSLGSTADATVTVTEPLAISPNAITLLENGTTTFSAVGGVAPVTFSIDAGGGSIDPVTGAFVAPATAEVVTVRVEDALGNFDEATVTVVPPVQISPSTKTLAVNNTFTFTATNGIAPYSYSITSGGGSINASTGAFTAPAAAGSVTVRVTDSAGSHSSATVTVNAALEVSPTTMELVKGESAAYSTSGGVPAITSSIVSGTASVAGGNITAGSTAGTAVVRFTDSLSNHADVTVTIAELLTISAPSTDISINANLTFTGAGGFTAYTYSKVSGVGSIDPSTGVFSSATGGGATLRVTDRLGHTADRSVTVHAAPSISPATITLAVLNTTTFTASGGLAPYTYAIQSGGGTVSAGGFFTAPMSADTTVVRVTDALGNTSDATVTINAALAISPVSSTMNTNATASFSTTGGVSPVTYAVQAGTGSIGMSTGSYTAGASAGSVTIRATDSRGNISDASITVVVPVTISPTTRTLAVNNTATFSGVGGQAPYTFSKFSGDGTINASTGVYTAAASAGSAVVRVTDNLGSTADASITVNAALAISPTSRNLYYAGTHTFTATGGVTAYSYSVVSGGGSINSSTGAYTAPSSTATVTVRVTDSYGNTSDATVNVTPTLTISPTSATLAVNNTQTFTGGGGQSPYTFSKVSGTGTINSSTGVYTAPASSGSAVVRVTDALGNTTDASITVNGALAISPTTTYALVDGSRSFSATGGVTPYTYSVVSGGGSITSSGGVYTAPATVATVQVRVTDNLGNVANAALEVVEPLTITPASANILANDTEDFVGAGGQLPYTYSVVGGGVGSIDSTGGTYTASASSGTATVRVTDNLGLTANASVTVYQPLTLSPLSITLGPDNVMTFTATGGLGALTFSIFSGGGSIDPSTGDFTAPSSAGTVKVRVTDSIGNMLEATVTVNNALTITPLTFKMATGLTKTFTVANGVPPYTMTVIGSEGSVDTATKVFTAGSITEDVVVRVTDNVGNTADAEVEVVKPVRLVTGGYNNCLIHEDGSLRCWGDNGNGQLGIGSTSDRGDAVGELGSALGFIDLGTDRTVKDLAIGSGHMCAILDNDLLKCWGLNANGQLGLGDIAKRGDGANEMGENLPYVNVGAGRTVKKIFAGATNTCAILDNDALKCWGLNSYGQLGLGDILARGDAAGEMGDTLPAVSLGTGRYAKSVAMASVSTCAILDNNTMKCWGRNNRGQSLTGGTTTRGDAAGEMGDVLPVSNVGVGRTVKMLTAGASHFCAILDNDLLKCWGQGTSGVLGSGGTAHLGDAAGEVGDSLAYVSLSSTGGVTVVSVKSHAGASNTCAVLSTGALKCWGVNTYGQLGQNNVTTRGDGAGEMGDSLVATDLGATFNPTQYSIGITHGCAMNASRQLKCWGRASNAALGNASTTLNLGDAAGEMGDALPLVNY